MPQAAEARRPAADIPVSPIDPFSIEFLRDPHPAHEALREAGPVVWLERYGAYAAARHAEVRQILGDPATFCSSRGVGLERLRPRDALAPAEPRARARPARTRSRARGAQSRAVGDGDARLARPLRRGCGSAGGRTRRQRPLRRGRRLRRSLPDDGDAGRGRPVERGARASAALCGDGVQHVRPRQRPAPRRAGADGAARRVDRLAMQARDPGGRRHRGDDPRRGGRGRGDAPGGGAPGALAAQRRLRHDRARHRRRDALSRPQSRPVRRAARRADRKRAPPSRRR